MSVIIDYRVDSTLSLYPPRVIINTWDFPLGLLAQVSVIRICMSVGYVERCA